jgi:deazaflavin-dependent oxidoreductase (nitroreductase family)
MERAFSRAIPAEKHVDLRIRNALDRDRVIDITTTGHKSGTPRRIEIWFFRAGGRLYLTGAPGRRRSWYRNLVAHPAFTFHLKQSAKADLDALAHPILDEESREAILRDVLAQLEPGIPADWMPGMSEQARAATDESFAMISKDPEAVLPLWLEESPLVEVRLGS